tara:strand:- start:22361 stop:22714 length:354 start_codon:yes stop_codon:yes gene_type:complete
MPQFAYVVLSNPVADHEDQYNDWYSNQHLADVTAVEGFVSAQRFRLADAEEEGAPHQRYMAIYTMETDDPASVVERLTSLVQSGGIHMSEAFSMEDMALHLYETITPIVAANPKDRT